jgi:hypothetical protein
MIARDDNGKFIKGNGGGPGRPKRDKESAYLEIMRAIVTDKKWRSIVQKAADKAEHGDAIARKWLADYLIGPPKQDIDVTSAGEKLCVVIRGPVDEDNPGDV